MHHFLPCNSFAQNCVKDMNRDIGRFEISEKRERHLKNIAFGFGLLSAVAVIFDLYPYTMFLSFPFCLIWIYCGWLHTEPQLKWINVIFLLIYGYGIAFYFWQV